MRNFHYEVKIDFAYSTGGGVGKPKTEKEIQAEATRQVRSNSIDERAC